MKSFARADRVSSQIQKTLSYLLKKEIKDPRLDQATITGVKMSPDLKLAHIYFSVSGASSERERLTENAEKAFKNALGFIKRALAGRLGLRYMPDLRFHYDRSFDYAARIDSVLKKLKTENASDNRSS